MLTRKGKRVKEGIEVGEKERALDDEPPLRRGFALFTPSHSLSPALTLSRTNRTFLTAGVVTLAVVWLGPLPHLAQGSFSAHMAMHMGVVAVAAPLLVLGIAGGRLDPVLKIPALLPPIPTSLAELVVVWTWHAPALHHAARHSKVGLVAEQGTFLLAGIVVWLSAFGGDALHRGNRTAAGVIGLLLTSMHMTLLGALLALTPRPLYAHEGGFWGLTPLEDQHLGGAIMLLVGGIAYLLGGLWLTVRLVRNTALKPGEEA